MVLRMSAAVRLSTTSGLLGFFYREVAIVAKRGDVERPRVFAFGFGFLQGNEIFKVGFGERIGFAKGAVEVKLVIPHTARGFALGKEEHHGFYARARKHALREVENSVQVTFFK